MLKNEKWNSGKMGETQFADLTVPCRECEACLKARAAHWRYRAVAEYRAAPRTWLVTLTLSPDQQFLCLTRALRNIDAQGVDVGSLSDRDLFDLRQRETGRLVTLYLKRLRKDGCSIRYMLVCEAHKSGLPHYHLLVHELQGSLPVRHKQLKRHWTYGLSDARLVESVAGATYATKYLTKTALARVRASVGYGSAFEMPETLRP